MLKSIHRKYLSTERRKILALLRYVNLIRRSSIKELTDPAFLESRLLPRLGLHTNSLRQFPGGLHPFIGKGLRSSQYPVQFSRYLVRLADHDVKSYLEIGVKFGGTFIITVEYLRKIGRLKKAVAIDRYDCPALRDYSRLNRKIEFHRMNSHGIRFRDLYNQYGGFDLVFIDGDHSGPGARKDFDLVKKQCRVIVMHDIANCLYPELGRLREDVKKDFRHAYDFYEFTDQYESVYSKEEQSYLGIGMMVRKPAYDNS